MSAESAFLGEISRLKRIIFIRFVYRTLAWAFLILLGAGTIVLIIEKAGISEYSRYSVTFIISAAVILCVAFLGAYLRRRKFLHILIDIDTRLKLQDRITTAYEYQKSGIKSIFSDLLMQDAAVRIRQLSAKHILPVKFSVLHVSVLLMLITGVALYSSDYLIHSFKPAPEDQKKIEKARALVQNFTTSRSEANKVQKERRNDAYAKKWEHLAKTIDDRNLTRDQVFGTLNRFLKEIQGEQARLANELGSKLNRVEIDQMPVQNISDLQNLSASQLEKLNMLLSRSLNNPIPDSVKQNIESLQDLYNMEKLLSRIVDDFNEEKSVTEALAESEHREGHTPGGTTDPEKAQQFTKQSKPSGSVPGTKRNRGSAGGPDFDSSRGQEFGVPGEIGLPRGNAAQAGRGKSAGKKKPGHEFERSTDPGIADKLNSSQVKNYLIQIRSLTAIGESKVQEENILRTYEQELETVLQKEEMPLNYREYIKQYFMSIGIKTADSAPSGTQGGEQ